MAYILSFLFTKYKNENDSDFRRLKKMIFSPQAEIPIFCERKLSFVIWLSGWLNWNCYLQSTFGVVKACCRTPHQRQLPTNGVITDYQCFNKVNPILFFIAHFLPSLPGFCTLLFYPISTNSLIRIKTDIFLLSHWHCAYK